MTEKTIRLSKSIVGQEEAAAVSRVLLEDGYLGMGKEVNAFENEIAAFLDVSREQVVCVNSGTAALHLAAQGTLEPGDEILVQSLTYVATFQAISAAGMIPIACEVCPKTLTIDINDAKKRLSNRTKAIMPVHYASNPGDLNAIYRFAAQHNLRVIEDAAHAFGCTYNGKRMGSFGDVACFSFDGIKNITSGEGGVVVTSDRKLVSRIRDARLLGVMNDTEKRYAGKRSWDFDVRHQGYRYHMSNVMAAIGRVQLKRFEKEFAPKRMTLARRYRECLEHVAGVTLLETELGSVVPHIQPVRILDGKRDGVKNLLEKCHIQTGIHYKPNHLLTMFGGGEVSLPRTEALYDELLSLPLHPGLALSDVERVCKLIMKALNGGRV